MRRAMQISGLALAATLAGCAHNSPYEPADPLEPVNRSIYRFNMTADKYVLRPAAVGYTKVVPDPVRTGIGNFFSNLSYPTVIVSDLLQGKFEQGGRDLGRFAMNTTFGLAGFLDPASRVGLTKNDEDLGQTFGRWGVGAGWYLMLPVFGPTTNRDLVGTVGDWWTTPLQYTELNFGERIGVGVARGVHSRSTLLEVDKILEQQLDPYVFMRTAYLQQRISAVYDGDPPAALLEPELPDE